MGEKKDKKNMNTKKILKNKKFVFVLIGLIILVTAAVLFKTYNKIQLALFKKPVTQQVAVRRSKPIGIITLATTAKKIDPQTQNVILAARVFTLSDKTVYLVLDLNNPPVGTPIDIIKTRNGRFVNHEEVVIKSPNSNRLVFTWKANVIGSFLEGRYKIKTYEKGVLAKRVEYIVQRGQVLIPSENDLVLASDPDYHLK